MKELYPTSFLNTTLGRWVASSAQAPRLDCAACMRPAKCCAFQPFIPNFLLGGWLEGESSLPEKMENVCFQPIGAVARFDYRERHSASVEPGIDLLCGFFDRAERSCRLWRFRPGECSTYFCDDQRLSPGRQEIRQRSFDVETAVAQMALVELGFSAREIREQVDVLNRGEPCRIYPGPDLLLMYKKAWKWCLELTPQTVNSWVKT